MQNDLFTVKPVQVYRGAQYPAAPDSNEEFEEERTHPAVLFVTMLLVLGISIGLIGCYLRTDYVPETPQPQPDGGPDGDPPIPPECDDGELRCVDGEESYLVIEICEDGAWTEENCGDICLEEYGPGYASYGCQDDLENPCQCVYDVLDGDPIYCGPDSVFMTCTSDTTVEICEFGSLSYQSCNDYCYEAYGLGSISYGCDNTTDDPCQCETDILAGEPAVCTPGDITCLDDETLGICENEWDWWTSVDCGEYCVETFGSEYLSEGCDASTEDHCLCVAPDSGSGGSGE